MEWKSAFIPGPRGVVSNGHGKQSLKRRKCFKKESRSSLFHIERCWDPNLSLSVVNKSFGSPFQGIKIKAAGPGKFESDME